MDFRKTSQFLMPAEKPAAKEGLYDIYPDFALPSGKIQRELKTLAGAISKHRLILLDGYQGVFFEDIRRQLDPILRDEYKIEAKWIDTREFLKPSVEIENLVAPFLGGDDPLFGTKTTLLLEDFFSIPLNSEDHFKRRNEQIIIYGTGASLFCTNGFLVYFDLPKNELQFRSRAGSITNLAASSPDDPKTMYKRFYFVDWVVLNRHKRSIAGKIDILADGQRPDDITWMYGEDFRGALKHIGSSAFRVRPWFEPGTWGGNWIKKFIAGINKDVPNYAWSFELISPENGIILSSSGLMLEFSFDFLMYCEASSILGENTGRFGSYFPIRFDFLDTFDGGNLSVQVHPLPGYMKDNFGEDFSQEESYYILDTKDNAGVYLGFREDISGEDFRMELETSFMENREVEIDKYVQQHPSKKHDLFLIPGGTIHGSGKNNLVLEISSTPYIFTFKMYDWLRPDLDGKPRTLNIQRGMENLCFSRKGAIVRKELLCQPVLLEKGDDWELFHLPTHPTQLFDVRRYHFRSSLHFPTNNKCLVMSLVEGSSILVETRNGRKTRFSYAESFIVPAAADSLTISNESEDQAVLVLAYIK